MPVEQKHGTKQIITLTGDLGSGKSSIAANLRQELGYECICAGDIQRKIAKQKGLTTLALNKLSETDKSIDSTIDGHLLSLNKRDNIIVDSRLAWHFLDHSFKVYLTVDSVIAAKRIFADSRSTETYVTVQETLQKIKERKLSEIERFRQLYQINLDDFSNYDLIVDTSSISIVQASEKILSGFKAYLKSKSCC